MRSLPLPPLSRSRLSSPVIRSSPPPPADQHVVVATPTVEEVLAWSAHDLVASVVAVQLVVAIAAVEEVVLAARVDGVVADAATDVVDAVAGGDRVVAHPGEDHVAALRALDVVIARAADDRGLLAEAGRRRLGRGRCQRQAKDRRRRGSDNDAGSAHGATPPREAAVRNPTKVVKGVTRTAGCGTLGP